jgi:hypothetical protein
LVSFLGVAPPGLPVAPAIVAVRGELFGSLALVIFGLGTGTASGDTVRSPIPILGNGATGLLSCLPGRLGLWKDGGWNCAPGTSEGAGAIVIFGDSGPCMGAVGATVFFSGCAGGGRRVALSWFKSLRRTDLVRSLLVSDRLPEDNTERTAESGTTHYFTFNVVQSGIECFYRGREPGGDQDARLGIERLAISARILQCLAGLNELWTVTSQHGDPNGRSAAELQTTAYCWLLAIILGAPTHHLVEHLLEHVQRFWRAPWLWDRHLIRSNRL